MSDTIFLLCCSDFYKSVSCIFLYPKLEQYKLSRGSFAFDAYVQRVFEKLLLELVTIRNIDWVYVCILVCANWLRSHLSGDGECGASRITGYGSPEKELCLARSSVRDFTILGALIFRFFLSLATTISLCIRLPNLSVPRVGPF